MKENNKEKKITIKLISNIIASLLIVILLLIKDNIVSELSKIVNFVSIGLFVLIGANGLQKIDEKGREKFFQNLDLFSLLLWTCLFFQVFFSFCFFRATVDGNSMLPTLYNSQNVIVRSNNNVDYNDVVVISVDEKINTLSGSLKDKELIVKRIIGKPGDYVAAINGIVYLNGQPLDESYLSDGTYTNMFTLESIISKNVNLDKNHIVIPDDYYLVLGDNRDISNDSRYMGLFHESQILGIVKYEMKESIFNWEKVK